MKITITIRNCIIGKDFDIQIDNGQRIATTLRVLMESLPDAMEGLSDEPLVKSGRTKRRVALEESYEHEEIWSGDILLLNHKGM